MTRFNAFKETSVDHSFSLQRNKSHFLEIVALDLLHEMRSDFCLSSEDLLQTLLHWYLRDSNHISHSHYGCQLQIGSMDKDLPLSRQRSLNEPIRDSIEFLHILLGIVMKIYCEIVKVFISLRILFAGNIQDVSYSKLKQRFYLYSRDESPVE